MLRIGRSFNAVVALPSPLLTYLLAATGYGFVDYEDRLDAEDAIKNLHGYEIFGGRLVVEHAKGLGNGQGGRSGASGDSFRRFGSREAMGGCFKCGEPGHYARDCPENGGARPFYRSTSRVEGHPDEGHRRSHRSPSPRERGYDRR